MVSLTLLIKQLTEAALSAELDLIWLRMEANRKTASGKRPLKPRPVPLSSWQPHAIVMALLNLNW